MVTLYRTRSHMFGQTDLYDADLLRVAAATALPPSRPSSPVRHLSNQLATTQISDSMNTATTTAAVGHYYTSGPHVPVKLPPFDPKQPKRWFQQADAIFWGSHVISSQDKWDYVLPKLPTDVLNDISDVPRPILMSWQRTACWRPTPPPAGSLPGSSCRSLMSPVSGPPH